MRKYGIRILSTFFLAALPFSGADAIMMPPVLPTSPSIDFGGDAMLTAEGIAKKTLVVVDEAQRVQGEVISSLKSIDLKFPFKLDVSLFAKKGDGMWITSARKIEKSKIADITDEDSIVEAFYELFLTYPTDIIAEFPHNPEAVKKAYKDKSVEFGNDTMVEMYITVRELEERMQALKEEYESLRVCYVEGNSDNSDICESASPNDDELGVWSNYYKLNAIYDSILKITEELMVLKAQYEVAQSVQAGIEPMMPEEENTESEQSSADNDDQAWLDNNGIFRYKMSLGYAQILSSANIKASSVAVNGTSGDATATLATIENASTSSSSNSNNNTFGSFIITNKNAAAELPDPRLEPADAKQYDAESPFAGTADQFQSLAESNNVYKNLQQAMKVHNLKQQLSEYRKTFEEYNKMVALHQKSLEQLMKSEQCVVNYLSQYYRDGKEVWLGQGCSYSGYDINCDSGRELTAESLKNLLPGDALCSDNQNKICSNYGINAYSSRGGMSGWLISAYKLAKAEKTIALTDEDFATSEREDNNYTAADMEAQTEALQAQNESGLQDSYMLRPSQEEQIESGSREEEMVAWQLGAELSKEIGQDMVSSVPKWGEIKSTYKLWNDEKYFYDQYLKEKYQNMKYYIRDLDMRVVAVELAKKINDTMSDNGFWPDVSVSVSDVKSYNSQALDNLLPLAKNFVSSNSEVSEVEKVQEDSRKSINTLKSNLKQTLNSLEDEKSATYQDLDSANIKLNEMKEAYNAAVESRQDAEGNIEYQKQVIENSQAKKAQSSDYMTNFEQEAETEIASSEQTITEARQAEEAAMTEADTQRDEIYELNSVVSGIKEKIERQKNDYAATASLQEYENWQKINLALRNLENNKADVLLSSSPFLSEGLNFKSDFLMLKKRYFMSLVDIVDAAIENAKEQAMADIDEGYKKILNLGDVKYETSGGDRIRQIHKETIENISKIEPEVTLEGALGAVLQAETVSLLTQEAFLEAVSENICSKGSCYQEDDEYFVGASPKKDDFQAPKGLSVSYTAPLREIVHFDSVDFENILKSDNWYTTRQDFLDYGQDIPPVWKTILTPGGFVERDVDISEILSHNQGAEDFLQNSSEYPCSVGKYDIQNRNGEVYVYESSSDSNKKVCSDIASVNVYSNNLSSVVFKDGSTAVGHYGKSQEADDFSELAVILKYDDNAGLTFNDKIKEIMKFYEDSENSSDTGDEENEKYKTYEKQLLTRNQFSDYLSFVELEEIYQESVDELEVKIDEVRTTLSEALQEVGYTPAADFNLADENTYNEIMESLENNKNNLLANSVSQIQKLQPLNDTLEEKIEQINKVLSALQMDKDELVLLSDNMSGDSELSEQIKSKQADNQARSKYDEEAEDEFERNLNSFEEPYCAIYN